MIVYLADLLQDAVDFGWQAAKGAHFVLVHRMIDGMVDWNDLNAVQKIRERYAKNTKEKISHSKFERKKQLRHVPCFKFNRKGGCSENQDHIHQNLLLKHACQTCHQITGKFEEHARQNCPRGYQSQLIQNQSKNG